MKDLRTGVCLLSGIQSISSFMGQLMRRFSLILAKIGHLERILHHTLSICLLHVPIGHHAPSKAHLEHLRVHKHATLRHWLHLIGTALHGSTPSHELIHHISLPVLLHLIEAHHAWHTTHGHPTLPHAHLTSLVTAIVYSIWACLLLLLLLHELSLHHLLSRKYGSHLQICSLVQLLQLCNVTPLSQLLNVLLNGQVRCIRHLFPLLLQFLHLYMHRKTAVKECLNESAG